MEADADRLEFAPPPQPDLWRAFVLAIIAHLLLLLALTWGVNWKRETENVTAEAELWSSVQQQAAPAEVQPPPVVQAPPIPVPVPAPPPPVEKVAPPPPPPVPARKEPDIALEREKAKREMAERRQEELERQKKIEARKKQEELKREKLAELKREQLAEKKALEEKKKLEEAKTAKAKASKQLAEDKKLAALREEQMRRIQGLAGATGGPEAKGTAQRASGPSDSYGSRVRARVRPNIVFTDDIAGNPTAEVEVRMAPDGTITSRRLIKSSGAKNWDDAVLRALDKTEVLPRDIDGRVPTPIIIEFKPKG